MMRIGCQPGWHPSTYSTFPKFVAIEKREFRHLKPLGVLARVYLSLNTIRSTVVIECPIRSRREVHLCETESELSGFISALYLL